MYFPCHQLRCLTSKWEAGTRYKVSPLRAHLTTLEEDLENVLVYQDSPKDVLLDSGVKIELAINFSQTRDPQGGP